MNPSKQQQDIINSAIKGNSIAISAVSGSGKTSTLKFISDKIPLPSLYVAYNKSIADEASTKFKSHVECKTIHSLAYKAVVKHPKSPYGKRLKGNWEFNDVNDLNLIFTPFKEDIFESKLEIFTALDDFLTSSEKDIESFLETYRIIKEDKTYALSPDVRNEIIRLWNDILDINGTCKITHNVYLKLFSLDNPKLPYDVTYFDEFQDSNRVILDIILNQHILYKKQVIVVGDPNQAIYGFNKCINGFNELPEGFIEFPLSESFRFTPAIAEIAKSILNINRISPEIIGIEEDKDYSCNEVYLVRKNITALEIILEKVEQKKKIKSFLDLKDLWNKLFHIDALMWNKPIKYPSRDLINYTTKKELLFYADKLDELKTLLRCYFLLSPNGLYNNKKRIEEYLTDSSEDADVIILTGHKAKGLTFNEVTLTNDFIPNFSEEEIEKYSFKELFKKEEYYQEVNLIYVAATRAKYKVNLPEELKNLL